MKTRIVRSICNYSVLSGIWIFESIGVLFRFKAQWATQNSPDVSVVFNSMPQPVEFLETLLARSDVRCPRNVAAIEMHAWLGYEVLPPAHAGCPLLLASPHPAHCN
jgi:hypothetical protein